jgi:hypothetical protein
MPARTQAQGSTGRRVSALLLAVAVGQSRGGRDEFMVISE